MRFSRAPLLVGAFISMAAAPAPRSSNRVIYAVLQHLAQDLPAQVSPCVEPTLDPKWNLAGRKRSDWGDWATATGKPLPASLARKVDLLFAAARGANPLGMRNGRISRVPPPLILSKQDRPVSGPCALEGNTEMVVHWYASRPTFNGSWAFVEVGTRADGMYPPPDLWAVEYKQGAWQPKYRATRTLWYD
jgi:hypothetical protein